MKYAMLPIAALLCAALSPLDAIGHEAAASGCERNGSPVPALDGCSRSLTAIEFGAAKKKKKKAKRAKRRAHESDRSFYGLPGYFPGYGYGRVDRSGAWYKTRGSLRPPPPPQGPVNPNNPGGAQKTDDLPPEQ